MELDILRPNWLISLDHKLLPQAGTGFLGIVTNLDRNVRNASHAAYLHRWLQTGRRDFLRPEIGQIRIED